MSELMTVAVNIQKYLEELGLEKSHAEIFITLSQNGEQTVLQLSRILNRPRSSLYIDLDEMGKQGLVTIHKELRSTRYKAVAVASIKYILQEKQQKLNNLVEEFADFAKQMNDENNRIKQKYEVTIYKGQEGVKQILWNMLTSPVKEVVGFSPGTLENVVDRSFAEEWRLEFKSRNKYNKIIVNKAVPLTWSNVPDFLNKYVEVRTLEDQKIKFQHEVWFYGETLVVISEKDDPNQYGVEITDSLLVSSYRQLFDFLWDEIARKVV